MLGSQQVARLRQKGLPLLVGLILSRTFQEFADFRVVWEFFLRLKKKTNALFVLKIGPQGPRPVQNFIPLLSTLPPQAFFAELFQLFTRGRVAGIYFQHFVELQFRFGERAFRHALLGSAEGLGNGARAFDGGFGLNKKLARGQETRVQL